MNEQYLTHARIGDYIKSHPSESYGQIGSLLGLSRSRIARIARLQGIRRRPGRKPSALEVAVAVIEATSVQPDLTSADGVPAPLPEPTAAALDAAPADSAVL